MFREASEGEGSFFLSADRTYNASSPNKRMTANYSSSCRRSRPRMLLE